MTDENENVQRQNLTDSPHYLARVLMENGIRNMYGVVGIPVTDFARIAQGMGMPTSVCAMRRMRSTRPRPMDSLPAGHRWP